MNKQTSSRVSSIASRLLSDLRNAPNAIHFALTRSDVEALAGSALSQDETPGQSGLHPAPAEFTTEQIQADPVLHYFHYAHLPQTLRVTSEQFFRLAHRIVTTVPRNPERTVALRKLLEAKDAAVRANLPAPAVASRGPCLHDLIFAPGNALEGECTVCKEKVVNDNRYAQSAARAEGFLTRIADPEPGEAVEIGGHDIDREPLKFEG